MSILPVNSLVATALEPVAPTGSFLCDDARPRLLDIIASNNLAHHDVWEALNIIHRLPLEESRRVAASCMRLLFDIVGIHKSSLKPSVDPQSKQKGSNDTVNPCRQYTLIGDVGAGPHGCVKHALDVMTSTSVAVRVVKKDILKKSLNWMALERKVAIMKQLNHPNVVPLYEVIDDNETLYMVMKYMPNGPVVKVGADDKCEPMDEVHLRQVVPQLVSGLGYLHKNNVAHLNIRPSNILMNAERMPCLTDFGTRKDIVHDTLM